MYFQIDKFNSISYADFFFIQINKLNLNDKKLKWMQGELEIRWCEIISHKFANQKDERKF